MYTCAICGKSYEHVDERTGCEAKCIIKRNQEEKEKRLKEYKEQETASANAINDALDNVEHMIKDHYSKYKGLSMQKHYPYLKHIFDRATCWWF